MNIDTSTLGFGHFIAQADVVGKTLLVILIAMSVASWAIIAVKSVSLYARKSAVGQVPAALLERHLARAVAAEITVHGVRDPFSHLTAHAMHAQAHHARYGAAKLEEAGSDSDFVTRTIKKVLDEETTRARERPDDAGHHRRHRAVRRPVRHGVGRLSRAGGHRHDGAGTLDKVAGPVGEALIMTGLGLAVAVPAVMGYNGLTRANRVLTAGSMPSPSSCTPSCRMGQALRPRRRAAAGQRAGAADALAPPSAATA